MQPWDAESSQLLMAHTSVAPRLARKPSVTGSSRQDLDETFWTSLQYIKGAIASCTMLRMVAGPNSAPAPSSNATEQGERRLGRQRLDGTHKGSSKVRILRDAEARRGPQKCGPQKSGAQGSLLATGYPSIRTSRLRCTCVSLTQPVACSYRAQASWGS